MAFSRPSTVANLKFGFRLTFSVSQSVSCVQIAWKGVGEYVHALTRALPCIAVPP